MRTRTAVVLPDPLGPSRPKTVPSSTAKLTPSRARTSRLPLKVFCRSSTSMAMVMVVVPSGGGAESWVAGGRTGVSGAVTCGHVYRTCPAVNVGGASVDGGVRSGASAGRPAARDAPPGGDAAGASLASPHGQRRPGTRLRAPRRGRGAAPAERPGGARSGGPVLLPGGHDPRVHRGELPLPGHEGRVRGGRGPAGGDQRRRRGQAEAVLRQAPVRLPAAVRPRRGRGHPVRRAPRVRQAVADQAGHVRDRLRPHASSTSSRARCG